jgi:class I fructose-bisphosphate aldolase/fructose-bisphosphate aldolase/2-amino-3,7-dideoxy-D-threo-hept-6-ulosonate synthase
MTGLEKNIRKLFRKNGKTLWIALDHPQFHGPMEGLIDPVLTIKTLAQSPLDGFILNPGIFRLCPTDVVYDKKLIMRVSVGGSAFSEYSKIHPVVVEATQALNEGADAVIMMLILGSQDANAMENVRKNIEKFHQVSIPTVVEIMSEDYTKTNDPEWVRTGARIAAELGADIVKVFYCDSFNRVISGCPIPVVLAGGAKNVDILTCAKEAILSGAKGFAFGRNVFQNENPTKIIGQLSDLLEE